MISAVTSPQPSPLSQASVPSQASVRELAAAGYFRAIALWLNEPLAQQGIFVHVQTDRPGCLRLTVEFERPPIRDRLLRFLCHRIWLLNSDLIEGIYVLARPIGRRRILWQQRIRIVTPALKRRKSVVRVTHPAQHNSPLPPQIHQHHKAPKNHLSAQHMKTLRAFLLTGSAVAAFLFGCLLEVVTTGPGPALPSFSARSSPPVESSEQPGITADSADPVAELEATTIDYQAPDEDYPAATAEDTSNQATSHDQSLMAVDRPTVVDAALEPVAVIEHQQPSETPADDVTLLFGGDLSLDDITYDELEKEGGLFAEVKDYYDADISMLNLGSPLAAAATTLEEELHDVSRPEAVELLVDSGVDIVNLTNENLMKYGAQGLAETLTTLDSKGLYRVGAGRNEMEARRPEVIDVKGKRIAYLSYSMGGDEAAFGDRGGFNAQDMPEIVEDIQALRDEVDWIVVNYRWMEHLTEEPNFMQTNLARLAIDQGADVVVGYHPNVIQGAEIYKGRPIAYSLGDFVFDPEASANDQDSAVLKVSLKGEQMKVEFVPVRVKDALPVALDEPEGKPVLERIQRASAQFEQPMESPMVLDLNAETPVTPEEVDPNSPFVSPEDQETLPVDVFEDKPTEKAAPETIPEAIEKPAVEDGATDAETTKPLPDSLNLQEQFDKDLLQEWGPKLSSPEEEFKPIPENRQPTTTEEVDAKLPPGLLRRLKLPFEPPANSAEPDQNEVGAVNEGSWSDSVPAVPTVAPQVPVASPEAPAPAPEVPAAPAEDATATPEIPTANPEGPTTHLEESTSTSEPAPVTPRLPNRLLPEAATQLAEEPASETQAERLSTEPQAEAQPSVTPTPAEEAISPHGEPLVGPLSSSQGVTDAAAETVVQNSINSYAPVAAQTAPNSRTTARETLSTANAAHDTTVNQPGSGAVDPATAAREVLKLPEVALKPAEAMPQKQVPGMAASAMATEAVTDVTSPTEVAPDSPTESSDATVQGDVAE
jgi:poly-gamma-glutamate capsule biosynthesis protein CapA/YwtB (metallophosphatase superfamily)